MPELDQTPNLKQLHTLATRPTTEIPQTARVEEDHMGVDLYADYGNGLEVVRSGNCTVITVVLGDIAIGDLGKGAVVSISFDRESPEPTTFLRWDKIRSDNKEGFSIPKRQRDRIAGHLIERFAA